MPDRKVLGALLLLAGCPGPSALPPPAHLDEGPPGYQILIKAAACWAGGIWSDAESYPPPERRAVTERHCREVLDAVYGEGEHRAEYLQLRALEPPVVAEVARKAQALAGAPGDALGRLVTALADAQREAMLARRATHRIRRDLNDPTEVTHLSQDEADAVAPLRASSALERLLKLDAGDLSADAHALGILVALSRMETVRGLPKHLKLYAAEGVGRALFGVEPPGVPADPTAPLQPGLWLGYLTELARAGGYPVPEELQRPADRNMVAWHGILKALADRLRQGQGRLSPGAGTSLKRVVAAVILQLDREYDDARQAARRAGPAT